MHIRRLAVVSALAGVLLAGCGSTIGSKPPTTTTVPPSSSAPTRPVDIGLVRVWTPLNWPVTVEPAPCTGPPVGAVCAEPPCAPGSTGVHVSVSEPSLRCKEAIKGTHNSVWIVHWTGAWLAIAAPPVQALRGWRGPAVVVTAPALHAFIYGFGAEGGAVARSYGPSTLATLSTAKLPVTVPSRWRAIRFGNLEASVPSTWSVRDLSHGQSLNPGACGAAPFLPLAEPVAYVGYSNVTPLCPYIDVSTRWTQASWPADGLWLAATRSRDAGTSPSLPQVLQRPSGAGASPFGQHGVVVTVFHPIGSQPVGAVVFTVTYGGQVTHGLLGLGPNAITAERVLSSLRAS